MCRDVVRVTENFRRDMQSVSERRQKSNVGGHTRRESLGTDSLIF